MKKEEYKDRIIYYRSRRGNEPVKKFIEKLAAKKDKNSRVNFFKIRESLRLLSIHGLSLGEPYIKHIKGGIWELRPIRNRILFAGWDGNKFILLHHFIKKTRQTPREEIDTAQRRLIDAKAQQKEFEDEGMEK